VKRYLIIGSGPAGAKAAESLRKLDGEGKISVVTDERYPYYRREHLGRLISGDESEEDLFEKGRDFYKKIAADFIEGKVVKVSSGKNEVTLVDGRTLGYDSLLIASGGKPIILPCPGIELGGVSTFYTLDDARRVSTLAREAKNVAIIGGGTIAMKIIPYLRKVGANASVVEKANRLCPDILDDKASKIVEQKLKTEGTRVWLNSEVAEFQGANGRVRTLVLKNGEKLPCDMAIMTIGIRPSIEFLKDSEVKTDRGVIVDEYLRTNVSNIFAAGDVVQAFDAVLLELRLHPSWSYAEEQGEIAAYNMAGFERETKAVISLFSMAVYDIDIVAAGITRSEDEFEELSVAYLKQDIYRKFLLQDNRLIGALIVGRKLNRPLLKQQIRQTILSKNALYARKTDLLKEDFNFHSLFEPDV